MGTAIRRAYVDTPEGQIHYRIGGDGPAVVFVHQSPSSSAMWEAVLPGFAQRGHRAVAFDLPGFGMSDKPPREPDLSYYGRRVVDAAGRLGIPRFHVVAHHTGTPVAIAMGVDFPAKVRSLALWGIPLLPDAVMKHLADEAPPVYDEDATEVVRYWRRRRQRSGEFWTTEMALRYITEMLQTGLERPWLHRALGRVDFEQLIRRVRQPALLMAGDREELLEPTRKAAPLFQHGEFVLIPDANLDVVDEHPDRFVESVVAFVARVDGGG